MRVSTLALCLTLAAAPAWAGPELGQPAPALVVDELDGAAFDLAALRGHVVVINVWATWCEPCRAEMPLLDTFYKQHHAQGLELLGLSADATRDEPAVKKVMLQFKYPAALEKRASRDDLGPSRIVPMTYVFDRQGILRAKLWAGGTPVTAESLENAVEPLLAPQK